MSTTITAGPQHPAFRPARIRARVLRALAQLHGKPVGAWGETRQAMDFVAAESPEHGGALVMPDLAAWGITIEAQGPQSSGRYSTAGLPRA